MGASDSHAIIAFTSLTSLAAEDIASISDSQQVNSLQRGVLPRSEGEETGARWRYGFHPAEEVRSSANAGCHSN